jgi:Cu-Zn family superoxide dismutase
MELALTPQIHRKILCGKPLAQAHIAGSPAYPSIRGKVSFFQTAQGVVVVADLTGLPPSEAPAMPGCDRPVFAMHIHGGGQCSGDAEDPFLYAGAHYNPEGCPHPAHAGDLPPLFSNGGTAWSAVLTNRFTVRAVIGKAVIVHRNPDDFSSQPSGGAGEKIACGIIRALA